MTTGARETFNRTSIFDNGSDKGDTNSARSSLLSDATLDWRARPMSYASKGNEPGYLVLENPYGELDTRDMSLTTLDLRSGLLERRKPIDWSTFEHQAYEGYQEALRLKKPFVLMVGEEGCQYCKFQRNELQKPGMDKFSKDAVFAVGHPSRDEATQIIAETLKIREYPTITVLEPNRRRFEERGRITGFTEGKDLEERLGDLLHPPPKSRDKGLLV